MVYFQIDILICLLCLSCRIFAFVCEPSGSKTGEVFHDSQAECTFYSLDGPSETELFKYIVIVKLKIILYKKYICHYMNTV